MHLMLAIDTKMSPSGKITIPRPRFGTAWLLLPRVHKLSRHFGLPYSERIGQWTLHSSGGGIPCGLKVSGEDWSFRTEPFTYAQAWHALDADGTLRALGSDPVAIARSIEAGLDRSALVDDLLLGFRPDGRSPFTGVLPCGSARAMEYAPAGVTPTNDEPPGNDGMDVLGRRIAQSMNDGTCLELTGGVDSRLLLALGVAAGGSPKRAFTIGGDTDADVRVAREIADTLGMEHRTIPSAPVTQATQDEPSVAEDASAFVAQSGYVCNAAAYGWLPAIFRTLEPWRDAQLSGVGGEIGEGFYYTGFDRVFEILDSPRLWLRTRAVVDGGRWASLFDRGVFGERLRDLARVRSELNEPKPWRLRTDNFYLHARIHGWAVPVIRASAGWYQPITPFLSSEYLSWSNSLSAEQRNNRAAQREVIGRLTPELARITYAKALQSPSGGKFGRKVAKGRRLVSRVLPRPNQQPEQWVRTAASFMRSIDGADSMIDLLRTLDGVNVDRVSETLRSESTHSASAIGALLTTALAIKEYNYSR